MRRVVVFVVVVVVTYAVMAIGMARWEAAERCEEGASTCQP